MHILIVGNILKDVYLRLDDRTEVFERDKHGINWLDLSFDASKHRFFSRFANFGGAAVSLEVLKQMGFSTSIAGASLDLNNLDTPDSPTAPNSTPQDKSTPVAAYRYILTHDDQVSYLVPSAPAPTTFTPPATPVDYLYIDRSAELTEDSATAITNYLKSTPNTQLILYVKDPTTPVAQILTPVASLVFLENNRGNAELSHAPASANPANLPPEIADFSSLSGTPSNIVHISSSRLSYQKISVPISIDRVDQLTHLSAHSITAATILGSFLLGETVENSLKLAKINIENSTLSSTLSLDELKDLAAATQPTDNLELIAASLVMHPKGILAADESGGSIKKKFAQLNIPDTFENRHNYRNIFFTTPHLSDYVNGVILFDETARDYSDHGQTYVDFLTSQRIIPGIKVDQGLETFPDSDETYTKGLDTLSERLKEYYQMGLRFAKWRAAFNLKLSESGDILTPTPHAITENCRILADYAKKCQSAGLVPIVEPELVYDGYYPIEKSAEVTGKILDELFRQLADYRVNLRACLLKVNMVLAGKQYEAQSTPDEVGSATAITLKNHVPADLAGVVFLSGGQSVEQATANLASVQKHGPFPWAVTFSFARALQDPALFTWGGDDRNLEKARQAFLDRLIANSVALG